MFEYVGDAGYIRSMSDSSGKPQSTPAAGLTHRQRTILDVIRASVDHQGISAEHSRDRRRRRPHIHSARWPTSCARLEKKGYLRRDPNRPRAVEVVSPRRATTRYRSRLSRRRDDAGSTTITRADVRAGARTDRRRRTDPRRGSRRRRLPAPPSAGWRRLAVPAQGRRRVDGRRGDLRRRLGGGASAKPTTATSSPR